MGADQSTFDKAQRSITAVTEFNGSTVSASSSHSYKISTDGLSEDFKQFLSGKRDEFEHLVLERDDLNLHFEACRISYQSIVASCVDRIEKLERSNKEQLAEIIVWKSIAQGADSIIIYNYEQTHKEKNDGKK